MREAQRGESHRPYHFAYGCESHRPYQVARKIHPHIYWFAFSKI